MSGPAGCTAAGALAERAEQDVEIQHDLSPAPACLLSFLRVFLVPHATLFSPACPRPSPGSSTFNSSTFYFSTINLQPCDCRRRRGRIFCPCYKRQCRPICGKTESSRRCLPGRYSPRTGGMLPRPTRFESSNGPAKGTAAYRRGACGGCTGSSQST